MAIEKGSRFAIREGGRTVGAGTITDIIHSGLGACWRPEPVSKPDRI